MSEGQATAGDEPEEVATPAAPPAPPHRSTVDQAAVLLAVERVTADVAALGRALAAQPEEVAARLDVDAATAAIGVRVGALGSTLDQLRLSLLAALDRAAERLDAPTWLPDLQDRLDDLAAKIADNAADPGDRLARVEHAVTDLADGVRAGAAVADALDHLGQRLLAIEDAAGRVARDARLLVERVGPVPDRLSAIASQVDRITPLARAGDQAGSLFDRLDQVEGDLEEAITLLRARAAGTEDDDGDDDRFEGVIDVLAGVSRRQDQVTAAIASVVDQVRGPRNVDAVFERMEQRERSLAARLDRIDAQLRRRADVADPGPSAAGAPWPDAETARALEAVVAVVEQHELALSQRLAQVEAALYGADDESGSSHGVGGGLNAVLDRIQQQEATMASHLDWVGERLAEVAARLVPGRAASAGAAPRPDDGTSGSLASSVESIAAITEGLARLVESTAERLDRRLARLESRLGDAPDQPRRRVPAASATTEEAALRLARLRAERAQVQARLQVERLYAAQSRDDQ